MSSYPFNSSERQQILAHGKTVEAIQHQLALFRGGTPYANLARPATLGDGIVSVNADQVARLTAKFEAAQQEGRIQKFVPASGAATRMFKALFQELERLQTGKGSPSGEADSFFEKLTEFPFFPILEKGLASKGIHLAGRSASWPRKPILEHLLNQPGLGFGANPKGLLPFHQGKSGPRTALEEHFEEALAYCLDTNGKARLHFTVSPEFLSDFQDAVKAFNDRLLGEGKYLDVTFSVQKPSTDTIAANPNGDPFHDEEGRLVFRPGGHGALIENLDDLRGDIVILKNIDNVVPPSKLGPTVQYKKILGGYLLDIQPRIFTYLERLEEGHLPPIGEISDFLETQLGIRLPQGKISKSDTAIEHIRSVLDRPLRVCGMVRNEGEPGGGPFWVKSPDGSETLQIVEGSQINTSIPGQKAILGQATHFNPVDLVCGLRNPDGSSYNLLDYIDRDTYFIARKTQNGKPLLALERPGLWNGAMARWNTVFIEVPLTTFNPVKTIHDLLRPQHLVQL